MTALGKECGSEFVPPAPFDKGVSKFEDNNNRQKKSVSQRGYRKLNPDLVYLPYNLNLKDNARKLRNNMTQPERKIWRELLSRDKMEGLRFLRQKPIGNYIPDFYCSSLMLAIEIDGSSHFSDKGKAYDKVRTKTLGLIGIKVIRYTNQEVMKNIEAVYVDLKRQIEIRKNELSLN